jgi:hypothetical protein
VRQQNVSKRKCRPNNIFKYPICYSQKSYYTVSIYDQAALKPHFHFDAFSSISVPEENPIYGQSKHMLPTSHHPHTHRPDHEHGESLLDAYILLVYEMSAPDSDVISFLTYGGELTWIVDWNTRKRERTAGRNRGCGEMRPRGRAADRGRRGDELSQDDRLHVRSPRVVYSSSISKLALEEMDSVPPK